MTLWEDLEGREGPASDVSCPPPTMFSYSDTVRAFPCAILFIYSNNMENFGVAEEGEGRWEGGDGACLAHRLCAGRPLPF